MVRVALVTDSTALLPAWVRDHPDVSVVPLHLVLDDVSYPEGAAEVSSSALLEAMAAKKSVTTAQVNVRAFAVHYAELAVLGYDAVVSVHLSGEISGTVDSARKAASFFALPVHVVDSRTAGPQLGGAVAAALVAVQAGASAPEAVAVAEHWIAASATYFYVDSLEHLRRGGRIGATTALLGAALAVKPILTMESGKITVKERVRSASKAFSRLEALAVDAVGDMPCAVTIAHFGALDRAEGMAAYLRTHLGGRAEDVVVGEVSTALGAHLGPGMVAISIGPVIGDAQGMTRDTPQA